MVKKINNNSTPDAAKLSHKKSNDGTNNQGKQGTKRETIIWKHWIYGAQIM